MRWQLKRDTALARTKACEYVLADGASGRPPFAEVHLTFLLSVIGKWMRFGLPRRRAEDCPPYRQKKIVGLVNLNGMGTSGGGGSNPCGWPFGVLVWAFIRFYPGNPWLKIFGFGFNSRSEAPRSGGGGGLSIL